MKMLTGKLLPDTENEFFELLKIFFPTIYDVKYLMKSCKNLKGGLEEVAKQLEVISYVHFLPIVVLFAFILD
jgi:CCR4-NOT transcription complex subunit 7/8